MTELVLSFRACFYIAETALFREKRGSTKAFPWFMKAVTGGYVSEFRAGDVSTHGC
jgi:hypothetical protein